jgi:S1-C subfamily serine protease
MADSYRSGELIRVIGYPRGLSKTVRKGRIFDKDSTYFPWLQRTTEYVHISAIGYPGNSGSPVIDKYGRVVGVLFAGTSFHTEALIVPLEYLKNFLARELY